MKNSTPVKLEIGATEPAEWVRVIVLTDGLSDRIAPCVLPRKPVKLQKFQSHRFTPKIQVQPLAPRETRKSGSGNTWPQLLESRQRHRAVWFR
jgi:hypothetical protein